jgi:MFS family permease
VRPPPKLQRIFASLTGRNYRLFFFGQLISVSGTWMQQVAQDWLVLDLTGRAMPVGVTTALQFAPMLLLGAWGGLVADRYDKRRILMITQPAAGLLALALGLLVVTGEVRLWMVYLLAGLLGIVTSFDMPARQAFVVEMVGPNQVANAVALNSALINAGRLIGPGLAGVTILAVGVGPAFLVNAASYLAVLTALVLMDPRRLHRQELAVRERGQVREGLRYVWRTPRLRATLLLVAIVGTLGFNPRVALPLLARFEFGTGPDGYGLMSSVMAVGSIAGALFAAGRARPTPQLLLAAVGIFGVGSLAGSLAPTLPWELVALPVMGAAIIAFLSTANATLQLGATPRLRGRVLALHGIIFLGSAPFGGLLTAWLADAFGPRSPFAVGGAVCLGSAAAGWLVLRRRRARSAAAPPASEAPSSVAA